MLSRFLTITFASVLLFGCATVDTRIQEHQAYFDSLPAETQDRLRSGVIHVGDTKDMVYIALGPPDQQFRRTDASGLTQDIWSYNGVYYTSETYWPRHHRIHRRHQDDHFHYHGPETVDVRRGAEQLRIEYAGGKVAVIEQRVR